ncbi:MAG TPA: amylo-alpha-1,6-glucosidase, partial [Verrucomicrobiae bacterium]|nr:amylo-alpha-1,6-glucosidase [Verrucomicrobiae bacterium]
MSDLVRTMSWECPTMSRMQLILKREWLLTNGLGGYASGTVSGALTRRFHGMLIAALPSPYGRTMMFNHLTELIRFPDGRVIRMGGNERGPELVELYGTEFIKEFRLEDGLPVWIYEIDGTVIEKRIYLVHMQNTVHISYRLLSGPKEGLRIKLQPSVHFRNHEGKVDETEEDPYIFTAVENRYQITMGRKLPPLRFVIRGRRSSFTLEQKKIEGVFYRIEYNRGYDDTGNLWSPGFFAVDLLPGEIATLTASTEKWETIHALDPTEALAAELERRRLLIGKALPGAQEGIPAELVLAADQFIITPAGRAEDEARARAAGDDVRTVIAGYHWFTDWGRDTMISLEGLTLSTGRHNEAGWILRTFAHYVKEGLIPNMFPEGKNEGLYHTADATMWFFHAVDRYLHYTGDRTTLRLIMPKLLSIVEHHVTGTRFGIGIDPADGLLRQGAPGYQLTWMDAKVGDWVVTPRRGKSVETNALWYNALRLMEEWTAAEVGGEVSARMREMAERTRESFNRRFWYEE